MNHDTIKLVECPRDAMQGWKRIIPTAEKIAYLNSLLKVGFDTIDFGSFVSAKTIPQMADTKDIVQKLNIHNSRSKLLAIVANTRGAEEALAFDEISYLGFPFSVSPVFQHRNTNSTMEESLGRVAEIQELCAAKNRKLVIYISMGFGNPYGDDYSEEIVFEWVDKMVSLGVGIISLADTVGLATPEQVFTLTSYLCKQLPGHEIGVHLHSTPENRQEKLAAALKAGCKRLDGALKGIGGCPMADDELVGNMDSEWMIRYLENNGYPLALNQTALEQSLQLAASVFS